MGFYHGKINGFFLNTLEKPFTHSLVTTSILCAMQQQNPKCNLDKTLMNLLQKSIPFSRTNISILILFAISILFSCQTEPKISQEKMIPLMADVMRLEASQQVEYNYMTMADSLWALNYDFVLKKHQIDSSEFKSTLEFYKRNPSEFSILMGKVIDALQEEEIKRFRR